MCLPFHCQAEGDSPGLHLPALRFEMAESHRNAQTGGILRGLRLRGQRQADSSGPWRWVWVWVGACPGCSGPGGCLLLLERSSSPLAAPVMGEPLLQGDCKMDLAEAEAQHAKCAKLNQHCLVDCFFFHKPSNKHLFGA